MRYLTQQFRLYPASTTVAPPGDMNTKSPSLPAFPILSPLANSTADRAGLPGSCSRVQPTQAPSPHRSSNCLDDLWKRTVPALAAWQDGRERAGMA